MSLSFKKLAGALCLFATATTLTAPSALAAGVASGSEPILHILDNDNEAKLASVDSKSAASGGKSTSRRDNYAKLIRKAAAKHGVPVEIASAVVEVESNFNPKARGRAGEVGLMQIKPATARGIGYRGSTKGLYDPETNLEWGMKYLSGAHKRANGDLCGTILRYNAGHYAKRMNPISSRYCSKVKRLMASN